jgi:ribosomal RNA assembly protein
MAEFMYEIKVPKDRIAVLIGKKGEVKKQIEETTKTKIKIDSSEGDVSVSGEDALGLYTTKEVIDAIGRGFNPEFAMFLLKQDYSFEKINLKDYVGESKKDQERVRGRVIGAEGKSRKLIEELTETHISVYGKTVGIIGEAENAAMAKEAIINLLNGSQHGNVYKWLEKKRKDKKRRTMTGEQDEAFKQVEEKEKEEEKEE